MRKEQETDFEQKRLNLSVEEEFEINKENDRYKNLHKDPYYDQYDDEYYDKLPSKRSPSPIGWQRGQYENFEVRWTREPEWAPPPVHHYQREREHPPQKFMRDPSQRGILQRGLKGNLPLTDTSHGWRNLPLPGKLGTPPYTDTLLTCGTIHGEGQNHQRRKQEVLEVGHEVGGGPGAPTATPPRSLQGRGPPPTAPIAVGPHAAAPHLHHGLLPGRQSNGLGVHRADSHHLNQIVENLEVPYLVSQDPLDLLEDSPVRIRGLPQVKHPLEGISP